VLGLEGDHGVPAGGRFRVRVPVDAPQLVEVVRGVVVGHGSEPAGGAAAAGASPAVRSGAVDGRGLRAGRATGALPGAARAAV
jgi:hypothetical protein